MSDTLGPSPEDTAAFEPIHPPAFDVNARADADVECGTTHHLAWGARSDVGLVRGHNEDSFIVRAPLFCVCDGMGGHAAGEVASTIAVRSIANHAPLHADDALLGAAIEAANAEVIEGAANGTGKPGMGCTATAIYIELDRMAVAHVGDSRLYLLHAGTLVRVTHDHSFVEELVDAGEITADEARVHPSRSVITRALGSDPDMYADHFTLAVENGDRLILCSDGLSSMIPDSRIESIAVTNVTPQECTDELVSAALEEGGHDNVSVITVDVMNDGIQDAHDARRRRAILSWCGFILAILAIVGIITGIFISNSWYLGNSDGFVAVYQGVNANVLGVEMSSVSGTSSVSVSDLPEATQKQLASGISMSSYDKARDTIEGYRDQIDADKSKALAAADTVIKQNDAVTQNAANAEQGAEAEAETEAANEQGGE